MVTHTPHYDVSAKLHMRQEGNVLEGIGDSYIQIGESSIGVNSADPFPRIYGYHVSTTTAVTGTATAVRGNSRANIASASGTFRGGDFLAGNGTGTGVAAGTLTGVYCGVALKAAGASCTVTNARGIECVMDVNGDTDNTVSDLRGIWCIARTGNATITAGTLLRLENQAVAGSGKELASAINVVATSVTTAFTSLIDASTATLHEYDTGTQVVLLKFLGANGTVYYLVHDTDAATVLSVATSVS